MTEKDEKPLKLIRRKCVWKDLVADLHNLRDLVSVSAEESQS